MVRTLAVELAPVRVNAVHPGAVGDSPAVSEAPPAMIEAARARTPTGRLATMDNIAAAAPLVRFESASVVLGDDREDVDGQPVACGKSTASNSTLETKATLRARRSSLAIMSLAL
jgi:NAD(P)-dependent dehydrogenase (short-subunit alcohol dehydrogenase family)